MNERLSPPRWEEARVEKEEEEGEGGGKTARKEGAVEGGLADTGDRFSLLED